MLREWLAEREGTQTDPLFPGRDGGKLSRDALEHRLAKHFATAAAGYPTLAAHHVTSSDAKPRPRPSTARSTTQLPYHPHIQHESVQTTRIYHHADLKINEQALARTTPIDTPAGRYQPTDQLLAFLEAL